MRLFSVYKALSIIILALSIIFILNINFCTAEELSEEEIPELPPLEILESEIEEQTGEPASVQIQENILQEENKEPQDFAIEPDKGFNQPEKLTVREYVLGINDVFAIEILGVPELSREVKVQTDGKISIPYIENFMVAGKTLDEVKETINSVYSEYLVNPEINLKIVTTKPFIVYVSGAVLNPGGYELSTNPGLSMNVRPEASIDRKTPLLTNILIAAGGVTHEADIENVQVTNEIDNSNFTINLYDLIANGNAAQDLQLMAGDRVYVPKFPSVLPIEQDKYKILASSTIFQKTFPVKVMGFVKRPGFVSLSSQQSANLSSAIAQAGGYEDEYTPDYVLISRVDRNNKITTFKVDPRQNEIMLMPDDTVFVPSKIRPKIARAFAYTSKLFSPFFLFANIYRNLDYIFYE